MNNLFHKAWFQIPWVILAGTVLLAVFGVVVMLLWNALLPGILGLSAIGYPQAVGILALARILVGRFDFGLRRLHMRGGNAFREKWMKMTPKEQEEFIKKQAHYHHFFSGRCCEIKPGHHTDTKQSPDRSQDTE
ncbi:MAG: hypothetical protein LBK61_07400 [Spirochaetaceae bacterium]|jgi:hypothetical protein|nr:hypothetical protein [Spirochaetaceae bacterium]